MNTRYCAEKDTRWTIIRLVAAALFVLIATPSPTLAEDLMVGEYDPRAHVGRLLTRSPEGLPQVVATRRGRFPSELMDVTVAGRQGHLVLWKGSPRDPSVYPELWALDAQDKLTKIWPASQEFAWVDPEILFRRSETLPRKEYLVLRRRLPLGASGEASAWTRERLLLELDGVTLEAKEAEAWKTERQLLALAEDLLVTGQPERIQGLLTRQKEQSKGVSTSTLRRLTAMSLRHASGVGVDLSNIPGFADLGRDL